MKTYALVGSRLSHSFSASYFSEKFRNNSIDAQYLNWEIDNLNGFRTSILNQGFAGLNVTIPHKQSVIQHLDELTTEAKLVGAVNCVKIIKSRFIGHNTDVFGFEKSLSNSMTSPPNAALVFGNGGGAMAVRFVLSKLNIPYRAVSRNGELNYDNISFSDIEKSELLINCTPLGMYPKINTHPEIPYDAVTNRHLGFDLVYNPEETEFLAKIKSKGGIIVNGLEMLKLQAEESWAIWNS